MSCFMVACVDSKWGIGKNGNLLFRIKEDMNFFREITRDATLVCGYDTYKELPVLSYDYKGEVFRGLKGRKVIVLSNNHVNDIIKGEIAECSNNTNQQIKSYVDHMSYENVVNMIESSTEKIGIIGGESIYKQFYNLITTAYITKVNSNANADRYMINMDKDYGWRVVDKRELSVHPYKVELNVYNRIRKDN